MKPRRWFGKLMSIRDECTYTSSFSPNIRQFIFSPCCIFAGGLLMPHIILLDFGKLVWSRHSKWPVPASRSTAILVGASSTSISFLRIIDLSEPIEYNRCKTGWVPVHGVIELDPHQLVLYTAFRWATATTNDKIIWGDKCRRVNWKSG